MIGSIAGQGGYFKQCIHYTGKGERVSWKEAKNLSSDDPGIASKQMEHTASKSERTIDEPMFHYVISWSEYDNPTEQQMKEVADDWLDHMGLDDHQAFVVSHTDKDNPHLHLVINRVHPREHKAWDRWRCIEKSEIFLKETERRYDWKVVPGKHHPELGVDFEKDSHERWALHKQERMDRTAYGQGIDPSDVDSRPVKEKAMELKDELFRAASFKEFDQVLDKNGLWLEKKGQGMVVTDGGYQMKASDINRNLSGPKLEDKFGQPLQEYVTQREQKIEPDKALDELTDWKQQLEKKELQRVEQALQRRSEKAQGRARQFERIDQKMNQTMEAIKSDFLQVYSNGDQALKNFGQSLSETENVDKAIQDIVNDPEGLGEIENQGAVKQLRKDLLKAGELRGQLSESLKEMSKSERSSHLSKLEEQAKNRSQRLSTVRNRISQELKQELRESKGGRAADSMAYKSLSIHRAIQRIADSKENAPREIGKQLFQQAKGKANSQAGKSLGMLSSEAIKYTKAIAEMLNNPAGGTLKLAKSVLKSATRLAGEASRSKGKGL